MRVLAVVALLLVGCAGGARDRAVAPHVIENAYEGVPLDGEALPGGPAAVWPEPIAWAHGRYLVPYRDGTTVRARLVGGADVALGAGTLLGSCAHGDGFAVALRDGGRVRVLLLDGDGASLGETAFALDGEPLASLASDGARVLVVTATRAPNVNGPATAAGSGWLVDASGAAAVELGTIDPARPTWGDASGFIVGGSVLLTADGVRAFVEPAPGAQVAGARVFQRAVTIDGQAVTFDGARWLGLPEHPLRASRDEEGALLTLAGEGGAADRLMHVRADLTPLDAPLPIPAGPDGNGALRDVRGGVVLWQATAATATGTDHVFARLDRMSLEPLGPARRVIAPASRTVVTVLGDGDALAAWIDARGDVRIARW